MIKGDFMRYIKLGSGYFFKNSWWLFLVWLLPSIFIGFCAGPFQIIQFINKYPTTTISEFKDIFALIMPFSWQNIIFVILGISLVSIFLSMAIGEIENHMRSGKKNFKVMFSYVNNDVLVSFINILIIEIVYIAFTFLLGSVLFLLHLLMSGLASVPTLLNSIFAITLCVAVLVIFVSIEATFLINIPNMISNGYSLKEGISSTSQLMGKSTFKIILSYLAPYLFIIPIISLFAQTNVAWIGNILCFMLMCSYYSSLTMTAYFELSNTNRYDNRKYYNYN